MAALADALGMVSQVGSKIAADKQTADAERDYAQGQADQTLSKADAEKLKSNKQYADGVYHVNVLQQYMGAEDKVTQWAADHLDRSLPAGDQVKLIDAQMKQELGGLTDTPGARKIMADRYSKFIEGYANGAASEQFKVRAEAAEQTYTDAMSRDYFRGGSIDFQGTVNGIAHVTGDRGGAVKTVLTTLGQMAINTAAQGGDYKAVLRQVPTAMVGDDGKEIPSPLSSPANAAIMETARSRAEEAYRQYATPKIEGAQTDIRVSLDRKLLNGEVLTRDDVGGVDITGKPLLSPDAQASYIERSQTAHASAAQAQVEIDQKNALLAQSIDTAGGSLFKAINTPGGPASVAEATDYFDGSVQRQIADEQKSQGQPVDLSGRAVAQSPTLLSLAVARSNIEGGQLVYTPLKNQLTAVGSGNPGSVMQNLNAYRYLKAEGLSTAYTDDKSAMLYEVAIGALDAGEAPEKVREDLRTLGDKPTHEHVAAELPKLKLDTKALAFPVVGEFRDKDVGYLANVGYVRNRREALVTFALSHNLPAPEALAFADRRLIEAHYVLPVGDSYFALPKSQIRDPETAAAALNWWAKEAAPALGKKNGMADPSLARVAPAVDFYNRRLVFNVIDDGGSLLLMHVTMDQVIGAYRKAHPETDPKTATVLQNDANQARREAFRKAKAPLAPRHQF